MSDLIPAVTTVNARGASPFVLLCEHASNIIPLEFARLGLPAHELQRHIAWDIGAAALARLLSATLDAPLFLAGYSRLLIDCNRPIGVPTSVPIVSELTTIPGNVDLGSQQRDARAERFYWPFQRAVAAHLDQRQAERRPTIVIGVHSFTPVFKGVTRPWHAGILFETDSPAKTTATPIGPSLLAALTSPDIVVDANQPYQISERTDYTVPVHGRARGLDACLIEIRQDLLADPAGIENWSCRLTDALTAVNRQP